VSSYCPQWLRPTRKRRRLKAVRLLFSPGQAVFTLRSIGDNRSTNKPSSVEPLSPMAPSDVQAAASYGCSAAFL
jgi:hypothetical protein